MSEVRGQRTKIGNPHGEGARQPARDGIALIVVLGMLALMVLMGVSFSVYMRTERVAAGNFRNDVRARQLLYVALDRALADIATNTTELFPPWDTLESQGTDLIVGAINAPAMDWIPLAALAGNPNPSPRWIALDAQAGSREEGRIGYLVVNCSGLLDANYAGGQTDRGMGTNANEIQISGLPEIGSVPAMTALATARPFETTQELNMRGTLSSRSQNFITFSAFPTNGLIYIGGLAAELVAKRDEIVAGFKEVFTLEQAGILFTNLIDYVDSDSLPGNLNVPGNGNPYGPSVEPVPMFNEVYITNCIVFTPTNIPLMGLQYIVRGTNALSFECIYPFPGCRGASMRDGYKFNYTITFAGYAPVNGVAETAASPVSFDMRNPEDRVYRRLPVFGNTIKHKISGDGSQIPVIPVAPFTIVVTVNAWITHGGDTVDATTNVTMNMVCSKPELQGGAYVSCGSVDFECRDPRMNWEASQWALPKAETLNTMGAENTRTSRELGTLSFGFPPLPTGWQVRDGDTVMHVANHPLQTVGELGNLFLWLDVYNGLVTPTPFTTVRLYTHGNDLRGGQIHPVLNYFTVDHPAGRGAKGKVNLYTRNTDVIRSVYADMPINLPHGDGMTKLTTPRLDTVVGSVMNAGAAGAFTNVADLGRLDWAGMYPGGSDLDKEAFVRNAAGLFGLRQNFFVILLHAQTTKSITTQTGGSEVSVVAGVRAVAEVWRDPVPDEDGRHPCFIRTFKVLNE